VALDAEPGVLEQWVAFTQARCAFQPSENFPRPSMADQWWAGGSMFLSDWIQPNGKLEDFLKLPQRLAAFELNGGLLQNNQLTWAFLETLGGPDRVFDVLRSSDAELRSSVRDELHEYARGLSSGKIEDTGPFLDYDPPATPLSISAARTYEREVTEFGTQRLTVTVEGGRIACVDFPPSDGITSWDGGSGAWTTSLPNFLADTSSLLITSTRTTKFQLVVTDVVDDQFDCQEDLGDAGGPLPSFNFCSIGLCDPSEYFGDWKLAGLG
jgi:hypothetical protein